MGFPEWSRVIRGAGVSSYDFVAINSAALILFLILALVTRQCKDMAWFPATLATIFSLNGVLHALATLRYDGYSPGPVTGMLIFMSIYMITVIGTFAAILQMRTHDGMVEQIVDLGGLSNSNKSLALIITMLMFSLAGIPFFMGFFGKWYAFAPAFDSGLAWLVVVALLSSVVGAFYYLRVIKTIWFDDQAQSFVKAPRSLSFLSTASAVMVFPILLLPFVAAPARTVIEAAAASLF